MKKYFIHPADLHLVFNLINSTESFKHSESWTPICLPKFDSGGFLHAHVSYLTDDSPACLLLLTLDRNAFFDLSAARGKIIERMERHGSISAIQTAIANARYTSKTDKEMLRKKEVHLLHGHCAIPPPPLLFSQQLSHCTFTAPCDCFR